MAIRSEIGQYMLYNLEENFVKRSHGQNDKSLRIRAGINVAVLLCVLAAIAMISGQLLITPPDAPVNEASSFVAPFEATGTLPAAMLAM